MVVFSLITCFKHGCCQPAVQITVHMHRPSKKCLRKVNTVAGLFPEELHWLCHGRVSRCDIYPLHLHLSVLIILVGYLRTVSSHPLLDFCSIFMSDKNRPLTGSCVSCTITLDCTHPAVSSASHYNIVWHKIINENMSVGFNSKKREGN